MLSYLLRWTSDELVMCYLWVILMESEQRKNLIMKSFTSSSSAASVEIKVPFIHNEADRYASPGYKFSSSFFPWVSWPIFVAVHLFPRFSINTLLTVTRNLIPTLSFIFHHSHLLEMFSTIVVVSCWFVQWLTGSLKSLFHIITSSQQ